MEYSVLGPTGVKVSKICLGTATFGLAPDAPGAGRVVGAALDAGINFFETANVYAHRSARASHTESASESVGAANTGSVRC